MSYYWGPRRYPTRAYGYPMMGQSSPWMSSPYWGPRTPEDELQMLREYKEDLEYQKEGLNREIENIEKRIDELQKMINEGIGPQPQYGPMSYGGQQYGQPPMPQYGQPPMPQYGQPPMPQEKEMLEQQARALEEEIKAIKQRLDELSKGE